MVLPRRGLGGTSPEVQFGKAYYLTEITTYHWNGGKGSAPGKISLESDDGTVYGPWKAALVNGVYWVAKPNTRVPVGSYTVVDAEPSAWAQNAECGGRGRRGRPRSRPSRRRAPGPV